MGHKLPSVPTDEVYQQMTPSSNNHWLFLLKTKTQTHTWLGQVQSISLRWNFPSFSTVHFPGMKICTVISALAFMTNIADTPSWLFLQ